MLRKVVYRGPLRTVPREPRDDILREPRDDILREPRDDILRELQRDIQAPFVILPLAFPEILLHSTTIWWKISIRYHKPKGRTLSFFAFDVDGTIMAPDDLRGNI